MNLPFFASFIIFIVVIQRAIKRGNRFQREQQNDFWARERQANNVRRQSLDNLDYIQIPLDTLPMDALPDNSKVQEYLEILRSLSQLKVVNLTGWSNTDLKLEYGTANIGVLSQYDQNYTLLVSTLQRWAEALYQAGLIEETKTVLEFAISTCTDVSKSYYLLADIYTAQGEADKISGLIDTAKTLRSLSRGAIVRTLEDNYTS